LDLHQGGVAGHILRRLGAESAGEKRSCPHGIRFTPDKRTVQRFARLVRLVERAKQLLENDVYIHQFKINAKVRLKETKWEWHQDYLYWLKEDSMPRPAVMTAVLFVEKPMSSMAQC